MTKSNLRIIYLGTPEFAATSLRALVEGGYNVVAVVTMPDKPAGRGHQIQFSEVKKYALEVGLPVLQPEKLKDEAFVEELRSYQADLQIVVAFRMLPEVVWAMPRLGTFNLHASLLPQYRGAAPINWAVMNGDKETAKALLVATRQACKGHTLKVIIESGVLAHASLIADATRLSIEIGADFVKTSTGKTPVSATLEAANAMLEVIRESGKPVGFKASGGVRTTEQAADYLTLADKIMGPKWATPKTFRFGASGLRDSLLASMGYGKAPVENKGY